MFIKYCLQHSNGKKCSLPLYVDLSHEHTTQTLNTFSDLTQALAQIFQAYLYNEELT